MYSFIFRFKQFNFKELKSFWKLSMEMKFNPIMQKCNFKSEFIQNNQN